MKRAAVFTAESSRPRGTHVPPWCLVTPPALAFVLCLFGFVAVARVVGAGRPVYFASFEYVGADGVPGTSADAAHFTNPVLAGFFPDPSVCQNGDDYYLINSTFAYFPGIPIFHSRDLVNWKQIGHVISRPGQLRYDGVGVSGGVFAPAISHHEGRFYVVSTQIGGEGNFVVTATDPAGPWSDATPLAFGGIDPSIFFDDDGRAWIVHNADAPGKPLYPGHRSIRLQEFDAKALRMVGESRVIVNGGTDLAKKPIWIEGPHLYKRNGWYYLSAAEGGTGPDHAQVIFRSREITGPYEPWSENPVLTQRGLDARHPEAVTCTGHADFTIGPDGKWWAFFLGVRPYDGRFSPMGRETFLLPVEWTDDGWPRILRPGERVPLTVKTPGGTTVSGSAQPPLSGDFTWRDDFDAPPLSPAWLMLRAPREPWWEMKPGRPGLTLVPRPETLGGRGNPSYLGRRVQHRTFTATLSFAAPEDEGVSAGLAVFQNEAHHYFLSARRVAEHVVVSLEQVRAGKTALLRSETIPGGNHLSFRVRAQEKVCSFDYAADGQPWRKFFADADATLLTSAVADGFVGSTVGLHARLETEPTSSDSALTPPTPHP